MIKKRDISDKLRKSIHPLLLKAMPGRNLESYAE